MPQIIRLSLEQKLRFVLAAHRSDDTMRQLCRAWQISRQTGYKWWRRYRESGLAGLQEQSRAPKRRPHALPQLWVQRIESLRRKHPRWGPKKLRAALRRAHPRSRLPATSTIGLSLRRLGLLIPRRPYCAWVGQFLPVAPTMFGRWILKAPLPRPMAGEWIL